MQRNDCVVDSLSDGNILGANTLVDPAWTDNGDGTYTASGGSGGVTFGLPSLSIGDFYWISYLITDYTSGSIGTSAVTGSFLSITPSSGEGSQSVIENVDQDSGLIQFYTTDFIGTFKPVSIISIAGMEYNDLLLQYYLDNGATTTNISDAEYEFLVAQGADSASIPDMWFQLLGTLGYTGSLSDRLKDFWCIGGGSLVP